MNSVDEPDASKAARLAAIVDDAHVAILSRDLEGKVTYWNRGAELLLGYTAAEAIGRHVSFLHAGNFPTTVEENTERALKGVIVPPHQSKRLTKSGRVIDVLVSRSIVRDADGRVVGVSVIFQDITPLKQAEAAVRESEQRFLATFEQAGVGMGLRSMDPREPRWLRVNQKLCDILGYTREELLKLTSVDLTPEDEKQAAVEYNERLLSGEVASYSREKRYVRKDGSTIWAHITVSCVRGSAETPGYLISVVQDITQAKEAEQRLNQLAQYDTLTGLPNRHLFQDRLEGAIARARRSTALVALLFLDLDGFKEINDTLGHAMGDRVLQAVGARLRESVREADTVARLGGDEFTVILEAFPDKLTIISTADKLLRALGAPLIIDGREIYVTPSIGISVFPSVATTADGLLQTADIAMYHAKSEGKNRYEFYAPEQSTGSVRDLDRQNLLRRALERNEFVLHYQPKASVATGAVTGAEALIRWRSRELGLVEPDDFIPLAEKTGLIVPIGDWALTEACRQVREWQRQGYAPLRISVNLSPRQFRQSALARDIEMALRGSGIDASHLEVELTERAVMHDTEGTIEIMRKLQALGVAITLDDFGTGYSSLSALKRFPVTRLKVDRSFVRDLTVNSDDAAIVSAVVALAKSLGLGVVAEGVETREQLEFLARLGCDEYQGYMFARPLPPDELAKLLTRA